MAIEQSQSLFNLAFQRFKKNRLGMLSFFYILFIGLIAVFAYFIAPDPSSNANQMHLEIHSMPPGFSADMLYISSEPQKRDWKSWFIGYSPSGREIPISSSDLRNNHIYYTPYGVEDQSMVQSLDLSEYPNTRVYSKTFYWGTDKYGRDVLSRMIIGARISFFIGFIAVLISLIVGISLGAIAGYFGGKVDALIMWFINVTWSIPTLLLVIAITLALGKGYWQVFIAVGLTMWVEVARVVRGQVMSLKNVQYVEAAKALGYTDLRIITKHILPNIMAPVIVISAANFASAILIESGLSFLGIGAQPPTPSWGGMIKDHYNYMIMGKAYLAIIPGLAIMSLVLAFMMLGNTLRDVLDVKKEA